jgi:hypothetical protein
MEKLYQAPELLLIGETDEVVMGSGFGGFDSPHLAAPDFEFEQD